MKYFNIKLIIFVVLVVTFSCEKPERDNPWDEKASPSAWAPQNLEIEEISLVEKKLTWTYYGDDRFEGFKLDRKKGDEAWQVACQTFPKETRSWNDTEIVPNAVVTYTYRVYAYAGSHNSAKQNVSATSSTMAAPTDLQITNISISSITLNWQDKSTGEDGFKIERKYKGGSWKALATVTSNNFDDNNFDLNTQVYYRVCAYVRNYNSSWIENDFDATIPPPENLQITSNSSTSITLSWDYNFTGNDGFKIDRKVNEGAWVEDYATLNAGQISFTDDEVDLGNNAYTYRVCSYLNQYLSIKEEIFTPPEIGANYAGGIVFYLDGNGGGLVCAESDQSTNAKWGCYGTTIVGTSTGVGTGAANTAAIVGGCSETGIAARICNDLVLNGYNDWFLPSKGELNLMYQNLKPNGIGGFASATYWSSSEYSSSYAWRQGFSSGYQYYDNKVGTGYVRAVRAF